jgi:two-component system, NtrC family, nitrogen regulation sensor histidine kinase NtrY
MKSKISFEASLVKLSLTASLPLLVILLWMMYERHISIWITMITAINGGLLIIYTSYQIYRKLTHQMLSMQNLLHSLAQGDYSFRLRPLYNNGELGKLINTINTLSNRLSQQRRETVESQLLLSTIIEHIDVAIVALNDESVVSFYNAAAKNLFLIEQAGSRLTLINPLAFVNSLPAGHHQVIELALRFTRGKYQIHLEEFREAGQQHKLLFVTDVNRLLRNEERKAWQSLVRVISHEINNSLSPIASISQTLGRLISRQKSLLEDYDDLIDGLAIITSRANGLKEFLDGYKQLAKFPEPQLQWVFIDKLIRKTALLFKEQNIIFDGASDTRVCIDPVKFEQVMINLIKNAAESMAQINASGPIQISWATDGTLLRLIICDQGAGINNLDNFFVPFYSTKKNGMGIGLVLCREIIEAHNGRLSIANKLDKKGCCVSIELPLQHE